MSRTGGLKWWAGRIRKGRIPMVAASVAVVLICLGPTSTASATATTLYVDGSNCSNSGPGTQSQPFCTISEGAQVAAPGDTVLVSPGTYQEDVKPPNSGAPGSPITFQAAPGGPVTVTGGWNGFTISSRSWITINGFAITGTTSSGIYLWASNNVVVAGNTVTGSGQPVQGQNAVGIYVGETSSSIISGNTVDGNTAAGIYLTQYSTNVAVDGNEASFNAYGWERNANGIDIVTPDNTVLKNALHDNEDSGIQFYPGYPAGNDNIVADNISYHNMGITTAQLSNCSHPTTGNTSDCFTGDHGIDNYKVTGNQITGNTIYSNLTAGINVEGLASGTNSGITVENNISADNAVNCPNGAGGTTTCPGTKGDIRVDSTSQLGTVLDRDVLWLDSPGYLGTWGNAEYTSLAAFQAASGQEPDGRQASPGFQDPTSANFGLSACSPAIDMANSAAAGEQSTDIAGNPRVVDPSSVQSGTGPRNYDDAGAYEYQAPPAAPALQLTAGSTAVNLSWPAPPVGAPPINTYAIYRGTSTGGESLLTTINGPATAYTDSSVLPGTTYYYQMTATSPAGTSAKSPEASAVAGGTPVNPIAFRSVAEDAITSGATQSSIGAPAGAQAGDLMIAWLALGSVVSSFNFSPGWTPFSWSPVVDGSAYQVFAYYKVAGAGDSGATYTASWSGKAHGVFVIAAYSGIDSVAPLAGSAALVDDSSSSSLSTQVLAPSAAPSWAVALYSLRSTTSSKSSNSWTSDPALVQRLSANNSASTSSPWVAVAVDDSNGAVSAPAPCAAARSYTAAAIYTEPHKASAVVYLRQAPTG